MDRLDTEFWNGLLKGLMLAQRELGKILEYSENPGKEGIEISVRALQDLKQKIENVHTDDIRKTLGN